MKEIPKPLSETPEFQVDKLPPEVATILIMIGILGIPLPGPGIPFILAGGLALWPRTFKPMERRFLHEFPEAHHSVFKILERFEGDMNCRYPERASGSAKDIDPSVEK